MSYREQFVLHGNGTGVCSRKRLRDITVVNIFVSHGNDTGVCSRKRLWDATFVNRLSHIARPIGRSLGARRWE